MLSRADTIRRVLDWPIACYNEEQEAEARAALDALLAEIEEWRLLAARQLEQFTFQTQEYRAENQRLRDALHAIDVFSPHVHIRNLAREALAGDTE